MILTGWMFTLTGCSVSYQVKTQEQAKRLIDNSSGTLFSADSAQSAAKGMYIFGDSIVFVNRGRDAIETLSLRDIRKIETVDRSEGALYGAGYAMGAFACLALPADLLSNHGNSPLKGGVLMSGVMGAAAGYMWGRHETLLFDADSLDMKTFVPEPMGNYFSGERQHSKTVIRAGIELGDYLTHRSGSFSNTPGYSAGISSGIKLRNFSESFLSLGVEAGYTTIIDYYPNSPQIEFGYSSAGTSYFMKYLTTYDERYELSFVELGLLPDYVLPVNQDISVSLYSGISFGIGKEELRVRERSRTLIDSTKYPWFVDYGAYGEYNMGLRSVGIFNLGARAYYKDLMVDLRYRYTNSDGHRKYKNLYLQFGIVL